MAGIGTLLRSGRESAGMELDELARTIRITPAAARALEEEDWKSLPDPVFIRGFVTSWARAVQIDERMARDALARAVNQDAGLDRSLPRLPCGPGIQLGARPVRSPSAARRTRVLLVAVLALVILAAGMVMFVFGGRS